MGFFSENRTTTTKGPAVEYVGRHAFSASILGRLVGYGLDCRSVPAEEADPDALTLYFQEGASEGAELDVLLARKRPDRVVVVVQGGAEPARADKGLMVFSPSGSDDSFEIARSVYVKHYRLRSDLRVPASVAVRRFFSYAVRFLS